MTDCERAFEEALASAAEAKGGVFEKVTLRGDDLDALIYELPEDVAPVSGGEAVIGWRQVNIRNSDIVTPLIRSEEIIVRGETLQIVKWTVGVGCLKIFAGNLAQEVTE